jgi:hypothetical protein
VERSRPGRPLRPRLADRRRRHRPHLAPRGARGRALPSRRATAPCTAPTSAAARWSSR